MKSWPAVRIPKLAPHNLSLKIFSTAKGGLIEIPFKSRYQMYVCGITPYDATHLGHAATYLTFDLVNRFWLLSGGRVNYIQNITDIDDPLLERAARDGVDWRELAHSQIELFRSDMTHLRIIPPNHYEGAVDAIPDVVEAISKLAEAGAVYDVDSDKYFSIGVDSHFSSRSRYSRDEMLRIFAERGGDPDRAGKRDPLDPLLWLAHRDGEPEWPSIFGGGRPGWHIECAAIALKFAEKSDETLLDIQGGGSDLIFPHHEMSASQIEILTGKPLATAFVHGGMIGLDGEKMSKSKGNLVFVSKLISEGISPMAIRWALLKRHYRRDYMWLRDETSIANNELQILKAALNRSSVPPTDSLIKEMLKSISHDLDSPRAISALLNWAGISGSGGDAELLRSYVDALLGVEI